MTIPILAPPALLPASTLASLEIVGDVLQTVRAVQDRVDALVLRSARLQDAVRWQAPSARAFGSRAEEIERVLCVAQAQIEGALDGLAATRARIIVGAPMP